MLLVSSDSLWKVVSPIFCKDVFDGFVERIHRRFEKRKIIFRNEKWFWGISRQKTFASAGSCHLAPAFMFGHWLACQTQVLGSLQTLLHPEPTFLFFWDRLLFLRHQTTPTTLLWQGSVIVASSLTHRVLSKSHTSGTFTSVLIYVFQITKFKSSILIYLHSIPTSVEEIILSTHLDKYIVG